MKRISMVLLAAFCFKYVTAQSQLLKGTVLPNNKKGNLFLPLATKLQNGEMQENGENVTLVNGQSTPISNDFSQNNAIKINNTAKQDPPFLDLNGGTYDSNNGALLFTSNGTENKNVPTQKYFSKKNDTKPGSGNTKTVVGFTKDGLPSLTDNVSGGGANNSTITPNILQSLPSLTDGDTKNVKVNNNENNTNANQSNNQLAPLTDYVIKPNQNNFQNTNKRTTETVSPALMNAHKNVSQNNSQVNSNQKTNDYKMPPLESINLRNDGRNTATQKFSMPALATIEGAINNTNKSGEIMPQLAPIDGKSLKENGINNGMPALAPLEQLNGNNKANTNNGMPALAAIEGDNNTSTNLNQIPELFSISENNTTKPNNQIINNYKQGKVKTNLRGLIMPPGTTLTATDKLSYIFKPTIPLEEPVLEPGFDNNNFKPSAGGGMGLAALTPMESVATTNATPELASVYRSEKISKSATLPALAIIKNNYQYQQPQQRVAAQPVNTQSQQQLLQAAKNHQHDPNNPCCKVQIYKKKVAYKKPAYRYKRVYRQPVQQQIEYIYEQPEPVERIVYVQAPPPQRQIQRETVERIVYIPSQTRQQPPVVQKIYTQEVEQPLKQQDSRVIYRDYTNTYTKPVEKNNNCNCPNNSSQPLSKDGKKYYSTTNYDPNLISGPTSGDYPVAGKTSDVNMKYSFYINGRGKYSVGLYNDYCTILLAQNGKVVEYKVNGDPRADPSTYKPRLNYFGSPETIAGIPIEYNYNRSVHKIGNIKFEYDFEGFFKKVGSSQVLYTSRSSLQNVDGVRVNYDAMGNVTNVDANNGLIQYNPDNQSNQNQGGN